MTAFYTPQEARWAEENRQRRAQQPDFDPYSFANFFIPPIITPIPHPGGDYVGEEPTISPIPIEDARRED